MTDYCWGASAAQAADDNAEPGKGPAPDAMPGPEHTVRVLALKVFGMIPKPSMIDLADLQQAGILGLLQAKQTFDPAIGVPLEVYAKHRIRGEMLEAVHRARPLGARPRSESQAKASFVAVEEWTEAQAQVVRQEAPEDLFAGMQRRKLIFGEVGRMPSRYRMVVHMRYGADCTLSQIGAKLCVKESRACQLHQSAISFLRRALKRKGVTGLHRL